MRHTYRTSGTCSRSIAFDLEGNVVTNVVFEGGCNGNLKGICALVKGLSCEDIKEKLGGIRCGLKSTSCPDQLTKAIDAAMACDR